MHEYIGAVHIHSNYSDGTGAFPDIIRAASEVGLDFIMMTDHNTLRPKKDGWEGWQQNVMVLVGYEINDRADRNHYLAFGLDKTVGVRIPAQEYVRRVRERGGVGFIAHPDEERSSMPEHPPYPWTAWDSDAFDGIEIWNHMSEWMEGLTEENKFQRFIHPLRSITAPPPKTLARWDALNRTRRVVGIGGTDAHAHKADVMGFFDVEVFPYKVMFKSIHTHVLLDEPIRIMEDEHFEEDKRRLHDALRQGHCFVANSYYGNARGFAFYATTATETWQQGDFILFPGEGKLALHVELPQRARLRLLRNGACVTETETRELTHTVRETGAWRVEAWIDDRGWIYSNHIRIGHEDGSC
ncbi:MAG: CehA/McbA family metallohydrolase [Bacteroidetes bacterium]|nr:CehA/McbA family metallohydrolase [Bacteroidota bacterium]